MNINNLFQLAHQYIKAGNLQQAKNLLIEILKSQPNNVTALHLLGVLCCELKQYDSAIHYSQEALQIDPTNVHSIYNLGNAFRERKQFEEAITCYRRALQVNPSFGDAYYNLGTIFQDLKNFTEAIGCYQNVLQLNPHDVSAYYNMGNAFRDKEQFEEAVACYRNALGINPNLADAWSNLGTILQERGQLNAAELHYKRAHTIEPDNVIIHQNLICLMLYNVHYDPRAIFSAHVHFADRFARPLMSSIVPHSNIKIVNRRLRIGYVSPDFRKHSVSYFIEPVIAAHSRKNCEIFCYSLLSSEDEVTRRIQKHAEHWYCITNIPDEQAAKLIRDEKIDILVDLAGHSLSNRILIFARKPAPIQISWIGYPATTGLSTIDYKIVDVHTDPPAMTEEFYTENLIRLPKCFLCYQPDRDSPEVNSLPALSARNVTFGSFNNFCKVSPKLLTLWTKILKELPSSLLILKSKILSDGPTRKYILDIFETEGIAAERIQLLSWEQSTHSHLATYNRIDIALDTFPYNGATTTCEAMWMGVPVITLEGNVHVSRVGCSILTTIGLPELIAKTEAEYVQKAVKLANDTKTLELLRRRLRTMMIQSPLTDVKGFTVTLEQYYRNIFEKWCRS